MKHFFNGTEIIISDSVGCKKIQARKHKRKRINKKWLKRYGYKATEFNSFVFDNKIIMHSLVFEKIKSEVISL